MEKRDYRTSVYIGVINGKPKRKTLRANSQKELDEKVADLKRSIENGKNAYDKAIFSTWAKKWYDEDKVPSGIKKNTLGQITGAIDKLNGYFGNTELKKIHLSDFQGFINDMAAKNPTTGKPSSKRTLEGYKTVAKDVFLYAIANNIDGVTDFFKFVNIPKNAPKKERRSLTVTEQQWIIDTPHRCQLAAMIMMFSGLRRGELMALEWSDIDLKRGIIFVSKSYDKDAGGIKKGGKTKYATRYVAIPKILVEYLKEYKSNTTVLSKYVCTNSNGKLHTYSSFKKMWDSYLLDLNIKYGYDGKISKFDPSGVPMVIERFTPHYLRHTYATILFLLGVDVVTAKQYLGHSNIQITIDIYTDLENFYKFNLPDDFKQKLENEYKLLVA